MICGGPSINGGPGVFGVPCNPYGMNVASHLLDAAARHGLATRAIDLPSMRVDIDADGGARVVDRLGFVMVDWIGPYLLWGFPAATHGLRRLLRTATGQNGVDAVTIADDKAATAERLAAHGIAQIDTIICAALMDQVQAAADKIAYPVVVKRSHGAQGRWVRRAYHPAELAAAFDELMVEGPGALLVQPLIEEALGVSYRAIVTGGRLLAVTKRTANGDEWRSNIAGGAGQEAIDLEAADAKMVVSSAAVLGLGHAGVDLLHTANGMRVLEVNSCPDFTSMLPYFDQDLSLAVVRASILGD